MTDTAEHVYEPSGLVPDHCAVCGNDRLPEEHPGQQRPRARPGQPIQPCGTVAAYRRHRKAKDPRCDACWAAWAEKVRNQYAARQAKRAPS